MSGLEVYMTTLLQSARERHAETLRQYAYAGPETFGWVDPKSDVEAYVDDQISIRFSENWNIGPFGPSLMRDFYHRW